MTIYEWLYDAVVKEKRSRVLTKWSNRWHYVATPSPNKLILHFETMTKAYIKRVILILCSCNQTQIRQKLSYARLPTGSELSSVLDWGTDVLYYMKQKDSVLPWVCTVMNHRRRQNGVRTAETHLAEPRVPFFCSYLIWCVICYWADVVQHSIH